MNQLDFFDALLSCSILGDGLVHSETRMSTGSFSTPSFMLRGLLISSTNPCGMYEPETPTRGELNQAVHLLPHTGGVIQAIDLADLVCDADETKTEHFRAVSPFRPRSPETPAPYIPPDMPLFASGKSKKSKKKNTTKGRSKRQSKQARTPIHNPEGKIFRCDSRGPEELLPEMLPQFWLVPMRLPAEPVELDAQVLFWVLMFRPSMSDQGNWELWTKVFVSGRRLQAEMDVLQQKYIDMQEGQDSLMTALDRWNLSQTNKIKLNIDNRLLVSLEHCSDRGSWLLREIYLIESKGRDEGAQNGVRVVPFDPFETIEQTWDWIHTAAPPAEEKQETLSRCKSKSWIGKKGGKASKKSPKAKPVQEDQKSMAQATQDMMGAV